MQSTPENREHIADGQGRGRPPGRRNRPLAQRQDDRKKIEEGYLHNVPVAQIAAKLGLTTRTVAAEITCIRRAWFKSPPPEYRLEVARLSAEIDERDRLAFCGLDPVSGTWVTTRTTVTQTKEGPITRTIERPISATRLNRLLGTLTRCVEQRLKILGLGGGPKLGGRPSKGASST